MPPIPLSGMSVARTVYETSPAPLRRAIARIVPAPLKVRMRPALQPSAFEQTWEKADLSLYLDPDFQHKEHVRRSQELVVEYIRQTMRHAGSTLSVLDAGCGNGRFYRALAEAGLLDRLDYVGI